MQNTTQLCAAKVRTAYTSIDRDTHAHIEKERERGRARETSVNTPNTHMVDIMHEAMEPSQSDPISQCHCHCFNHLLWNVSLPIPLISLSFLSATSSILFPCISSVLSYLPLSLFAGETLKCNRCLLVWFLITLIIFTSSIKLFGPDSNFIIQIRWKYNQFSISSRSSFHPNSRSFGPNTFNFTIANWVSDSTFKASEGIKRTHTRVHTKTSFYLRHFIYSHSIHIHLLKSVIRCHQLN